MGVGKMSRQVKKRIGVGAICDILSLHPVRKRLINVYDIGTGFKGLQ